jgi:HSP20 family protein
MMLPSIFGDNMLTDFGFDSDFFRRPMKVEPSMMKTDVKETDDAYEVHIDLPGYTKDDVQIRYENGNLSVSASKSENKDEKDENGKYIRRERYVGSCWRQFYVGEDIRKDDISAKLENGTLMLTIPKKAQKEIEDSKFIAIED